jgi:MFS family permease
MLRPFVFLYALAFSLAGCLLTVALPLAAHRLFGASHLAIGLMGSLGFAAYTAAALASGRLADRLGFRPFLVTGCMVFAVSVAAMPAAPTLGWLQAINMSAIMAAGVVWPVFLAWFSAAGGTRALPGLLLAFNLGWSLGKVAGDYLGGVFYGWDWRLPFAAATALGVGLAVSPWLLSRGFWRRELPSAGPDAQAVRPLKRGDTVFVWLGWLGTFVASMAMIALQVLFPKIGQERSFSPRTIGALLACMPAAQMVGFFLTGVWTGWRFRLGSLLLFQGLGALGCLMPLLMKGPVGFGLGFALVGLSGGMAYAASAYYSVCGAANRGARAGVLEMANGLGATLGPVMFGAAANAWHPLAPFACGTALCLICLAAQWRIHTGWVQGLEADG